MAAVRTGPDTDAAIAEDLAGLPDTDALLDELVAAGLLTAMWIETAGPPYRRFALTPAGHAVVSRTIHP